MSDTVAARAEATMGEVVTDWLEELDLPPRLTEVWPEAPLAAARSSAKAVASVPAELYLAEPPPDDLARMRPHARALAAFALVAGLAHQSASLRASGRFRYRAAPGEQALACAAAAGPEPFAETLQALAAVAVQAHLATTFRKMGGGQKCSLRFFPEGPKLLTTKIETGAGRSGSRLRNVIRVLEDAVVDGIGVPA